MNDKDVIKLVKQTVQDEIKKVQAFRMWDRKDTPTDAYSVVNRNYSNLNGAVANRPTSSVATVGQRYFATDTGQPMTYTGVAGSAWRNGAGSIVAIN